METLKLGNNYNFMKWYIKKTPINKEQIDKLFNMFMMAYNEHPDAFMHILMYIAGTRKSYTEVYYKLTLHFLATNYPEKLMANIMELIKWGHEYDLLYLIQEPIITSRIKSFINIKYKHLNDIELPEIIETKTKFKYKLKKYDYEKLFEKIIFDENIHII